MLVLFVNVFISVFYFQVQNKWGTTKDIMSNAGIAAMLRDAAREHFCEELYKVERSRTYDRLGVRSVAFSAAKESRSLLFPSKIRLVVQHDEIPTY